jgi:hypothetical protein
MLTTKITVSLIVLGCVVVVAGFFYDVMFAGIPYQDPTPELLAHYSFHASVAGYIYKSGFGIIVLGAILSIIRFGARHSMKRGR